MPDKREIDGLQKVFVLGSSVIGGFAGSVTIGLDVLGLLTGEFAKAPPETGWDLAMVTATWLPRIIRHRFSGHPDAYRRLGASFLIGSVSPGRKVQPPFPATDLFAFRSTNGFKPEMIPSGQPRSIGCGSVLEDTVRTAVSSQDFQLQWNAGPRLHSFLLANQLRKRLLEQPTAGVSPRFMMAWAVSREQGVEPWTTLGADEAGQYISDSEFVLARNLAELTKLVGADAAQAVG
jgi:hypothetical protein